MIHGASKNGHNLDKYVTEILFVGEKDDLIKEEKLRKIIEAVRNIRVMVKNIDRTEISTVEIKKLFQELEKCRNQDNNPDSQAYKRKIQVKLFFKTSYRKVASCRQADIGEMDFERILKTH